jgi:predicted membrane protein
MHGSRSQLVMGGIILAIGLILLAERLIGFNLWRVTWPLLLIALGVYVLLSPRYQKGGVTLRLLGDIHRRGAWDVRDEDLWVLVGDTRLDLTQANIPLGDTTIRLYGLAGDLKVTAPPDCGVAVRTTALVLDVRTPTDKRDVLLSSYQWASPNFALAERRVLLMLVYLAMDVRIEQPALEA